MDPWDSIPPGIKTWPKLAGVPGISTLYSTHQSRNAQELDELPHQNLPPRLFDSNTIIELEETSELNKQS